MSYDSTFRLPVWGKLFRKENNQEVYVFEEGTTVDVNTKVVIGPNGEAFKLPSWGELVFVKEEGVQKYSFIVPPDKRDRIVPRVVRSDSGFRLPYWGKLFRKENNQEVYVFEKGTTVDVNTRLVTGPNGDSFKIPSWGKLVFVEEEGVQKYSFIVPPDKRDDIVPRAALTNSSGV